MKKSIRYCCNERCRTTTWHDVGDTVSICKRCGAITYNSIREKETVKKIVLMFAVICNSLFAATVAEQLADGNAISANSITPTKGSLWVANGTYFAPLAVGSNTQVLTADSSQTLGVKWGTASGGASPDNITINASGAGGTLQIISYPALSGAAITSLNGSNVSSGTVAAARLGSGSSISTKYLRGDNTWQTISSGGLTSGTITTTDVLADNIIAPTATTQKSLVIQGRASQSADLLQIQGSDGTVNAAFSATGSLTLINDGGGGNISGVSSFFSHTFSGNPTTPDVLADNLFAGTSTTQRVFVLQAQAGHTASLFVIEDSAATPLVVVSPSGGMTATSFAGDGSALTSIAASNIAAGGTLPALDAGALTNVPKPPTLSSGQQTLDGAGAVTFSPAGAGAGSFLVAGWGGGVPGTGQLSVSTSGMGAFTVTSSLGATDAALTIYYICY